MCSKRGLTLIELMVALFILALIVGGRNRRSSSFYGIAKNGYNLSKAYYGDRRDAN